MHRAFRGGSEHLVNVAAAPFTDERQSLLVDAEPCKTRTIEGQLDVMHGLPQRSPRVLFVALAP